MALSLVTPPDGEPITTAEAKAHLRVDTSDEDALVAALVASARQHVEAFTHRALLTQTWDLKLDVFPCGGVLELPFPPVSAVTSITYLDSAGDSQTWASSNYLQDLPSGPKASPARITPIYGGSWPSTYGVMNAASVRFVCGYGANPEDVPEALKSAMLLLIGHWYQHRAAVNVGNIVQPTPQTVDALLWPFRSF